MPLPKAITEYIDANADKFIQRLADAVAIPSISSDASSRPEVVKMATFLKGELEALGVSVQLVDLGKQQFDGKDSHIDLPPVILGSIGNDKNKRTVLLYAHYDVQPAHLSDGWNTEPFKLSINKETGQLIGRGASDDKGPLLGWLNNLQAHHALGLELPVNIKLCFEGMEESGSEGLDALIEAEKDKFFKGVNCVCISDNYWLNTRTPCLTYGLRGICYFEVIVHGPSRDLHSGVFGGTVHEPMTDLIQLMSKLVTSTGEILIPGVMDSVAPLTEKEKALYEKLDYSVKDVETAAGGPIAISSDKVTTLMRRMRYPSLSLHGIEGAFSAPGGKTVIPARVSGKFSIRLVPYQDPAVINGIVEQYLKFEFLKLQTKSKLEVRPHHGGKPWVADVDHWNYRAAKKATEEIYKKTPDFTREGGSIPVTLTFAEKLDVNVLLLPMGRGDDGAHSTNEKLDRSNFIEGTKLLGTYLYEVATEK